MADKTFFSPMPLRAMGDARLSALDHRVLQCIAFHDRMSGARGKGQGAWASNRTMALRVGCDQTSLSSAITRLAKLDYITRERHHFDKRKHVYRVVYGDENSFSDQKLSVDPGEREGSPDEKASGDRPAEDSFSHEHQSEKVVSHCSENPQSSQEDGKGKYIPQSGERYSVETGERNSSEDARLKSRGLGEDERVLPIGGQLAQIERALKSKPAEANLIAHHAKLDEIREEYCGEIEGHHAQRLFEKADELLDNNISEDPVTNAIRNCWPTLKRDQRASIAKRNAVTADEVDRFLSGRGDLPYPKLVSIRSMALAAAEQQHGISGRMN